MTNNSFLSSFWGQAPFSGTGGGCPSPLRSRGNGRGGQSMRCGWGGAEIALEMVKTTEQRAFYHPDSGFGEEFLSLRERLTSPTRAGLGGGELCPCAWAVVGDAHIYSVAHIISCVGTQKNMPYLWLQELPLIFGLINASKMHQPLTLSPSTTIIQITQLRLFVTQ